MVEYDVFLANTRDTSSSDRVVFLLLIGFVCEELVRVSWGPPAKPAHTNLPDAGPQLRH